MNNSVGDYVTVIDRNVLTLSDAVYKLEQYDEMFNDIKDLVKQLSPLATDLEYIKKDINKLIIEELKMVNFVNE